MSARINRRRVAAGVLAVAALASVSTIASNALFTDRDTIEANVFSTGKVSLNTDIKTGALTFANMAPGDTVTKQVVVTNDGTMPLRYSVASVTSGDAVLSDAIVLDVKKGAEGLYTGVLGTAAGTKTIGDKATGANTGDRVLAAGASETLTFTATLPKAADNTVATKSTTAVFTLDSEQTTNN